MLLEKTRERRLLPALGLTHRTRYGERRAGCHLISLPQVLREQRPVRVKRGAEHSDNKVQAEPETSIGPRT